MTKLTVTIYREVEIQVEVSYTPGDPGCRTMRNGDPGWPPSPAEVEIESGLVNVDGRWIDLDLSKLTKAEVEAVEEAAEAAFGTREEQREAAREDAEGPGL